MRYKKITIPLEDVEFEIISKFKNKTEVVGDNIIIYIPEEKKIKGETKGILSSETRYKISEKIKLYWENKRTK